VTRPRPGRGAGTRDGSQVVCSHRPDASESWEDSLRRAVGPRCVVLGIGNRLRGDDAAGCLVAEALMQRGFGRVLDCGETPENYLGKVAESEPSDVLFVDAVDFDAEPGTVWLFGAESFQVQSLSTHSAGLGPLVDFLRGSCGAVCRVLAVQPAGLARGADLSEPVREAVERIVASDVWGDLLA